MAGEIDRLELQVEAQATKANNQLDKMVGKLDAVASSLMHINSGGLAGLASGVSKFAQASSQLSNVKTADFTRLAKNIQGISSINTQQIHSAASAMTIMSKAINSLGSVSPNSLQVAEVAKSIGKLGGANVQRAITNLPALEKALHSFMTTMSQAPSVSRNVIKMTDALASLASQGGKVGTAANSVNSSLTTYGKSADKAAAKTKSLASMIGTLNANFFWMKSAVQKLYKFTESSMDFLETVNYFEVAMRDIGNSAVETWDGIGYESAEAYAKSFSERAKQLTEKMTGYAIDEDGNAEYSSVKNLGMDPDKVLQYQATFAQISSSIGVAEESALNFSKALTMLGADWASLRNLTFDQGWEKFASALAGQSRAVRSLGIDITNATLQEYAYKYGLEQAVSEMNQATKAQLRLLAILDQSKVAYGDLANTIESPANQIRMLQQNVSNLGRVFGNLFLPILQKTLPYINGMAIALQKLFTWIGQLLGIKFDSINSATGGISDDMSDLVGDAGDLTGELDDANDAAKKLNKTLMPWHEINNLTTNESSGGSGSGSGGAGGGNPLLDDAIAGALADYEKIWNEAFERMENKAQEIAGRIGKFLEPVKNIIQDFVVGDYFQAGKDTSALVAGIFNFFADAIDNVDWYGIGQKVGDYLAGVDWLKIMKSVGNFAWEAAKGAFELWLGSLTTAPLETLLVTLGVIASNRNVSGIAKLASKFKMLGKNMSTAQKGAVGIVSVISEFLLVKDGVYDLVKGSDNLIVSMGEIVVGAGVASAALNALFGPAGLVIAGITGIVAGLIGIDDAFIAIEEEAREREEIEKYGDTLESIGVKAKEMSESLIEASKARQGIVANVKDVDVGYIETLRDRYLELSEKIGLTAEEQSELKMVSEKLVGFFPELSDYYNKTTGLLEVQRDTLEDLVEQKEKELMMSAVGDQWEAAIKDKITAQKELKEQTDNLIQANNELEEVYAAVEKYRNSFSDPSMANLQGFWNDIGEKQLAVEKFTVNVQEAQEALNEINEEVLSYEAMYSDLNQAGINGGEEYVKGIGEGIEQSADDALAASQAITAKVTGEMEASAGETVKLGKDAADGYAKGISENEDSVAYAAGGIVGFAMEVWAKAQDSHSPSKKTESLGKDAVDGYNLGISANEESTLNAIEQYMKKVISKFSEYQSSFKNIGKNAMQGFYDGIVSMEDTIYKKADEIANKIAETFKTALDIHSPSKVMFSLGEYTMEGYKLGVESLYSSIEKSMGGFISASQCYTVPTSPASMVSSYAKDYIKPTQYSNNSYYESYTNYDSVETNELLRELLEETRKGHVIKYNDKVIGRTVREENYSRAHRGIIN